MNDERWRDHVAIRDLAARYNLYGDTGRLEDSAALFTPDGVLQYRECRDVVTCTGRAEIIAFFDSVKQQWLAESAQAGTSPRVFHSLVTHVIDVVDDDHATGVAYVTVIRQHGVTEWGRYSDEYVRRDGAWYLSVRRATVEGRVSGPSLLPPPA